jgi:hypothetical protein
MKTAIAIIILAHSLSAFAQGTFQNLDFESANLSPIPSGQYGGEVPIASALPEWSASFGSTPVTQVLQNNFTLGAPSIDIFGPDWTSPPGIISGSYTVGLQSGYGPGLIPESASLSQDGTIPANTESLEFEAENSQGATPLSVSFAGDNLTLFVLSSAVAPSGQPYSVYGANIAPYAGQTGQLEFTATFFNAVQLDDISFSTQAIPEASPLVLTGVGGLLFALYRRFAPRRR